MTPSQIMTPRGIPSSEAFGVPTITHAATAIAHTASNADAALAARMGRENYIVGYAGLGAMIGETVAGHEGLVVGGLVGAGFAFYRSLTPGN